MFSFSKFIIKWRAAFKQLGNAGFVNICQQNLWKQNVGNQKKKTKMKKFISFTHCIFVLFCTNSLLNFWVDLVKSCVTCKNSIDSILVCANMGRSRDFLLWWWLKSDLLICKRWSYVSTSVLYLLVCTIQTQRHNLNLLQTMVRSTLPLPLNDSQSYVAL